MFPPNLTKAQHLEIINSMSDLGFSRFRYCQEMAGAYMAVGKLEDAIISAMQMCDRIKVKDKLGKDAEWWATWLAKRKILQGSTLGSLISILEKHDILENDIKYLKWIKDKRDYFIHRLFHDGSWPGDLGEDDCRFMVRRLLAIQIWLSRAERNIWSIFERAGFVEVDHISDGGMLIMNKEIFDMDEDKQN